MPKVMASPATWLPEMNPIIWAIDPRVSLASYSVAFSIDANKLTARRTTDGTDEYDFAAQFQTGMRHHTRKHAPKEKPAPNSSPHVNGLDGHRSNLDNSINHPDDRPRAQHTDHSYRNGPAAESGSSRS